MIAIGCDHAGLELKNKICEFLKERETDFLDLGVNSCDSVDYAPIAVAVSRKVLDGSCTLGILCCGTGVGMSIAANKMKGIRAACCSEAFTAEMTRRHNDANILCMGGRVVKETELASIVTAFLDAPYEGGRHARRVDQLSAIENENLNF